MPAIDYTQTRPLSADVTALMRRINAIEAGVSPIQPTGDNILKYASFVVNADDNVYVAGNTGNAETWAYDFDTLSNINGLMESFPGANTRFPYGFFFNIASRS